MNYEVLSKSIEIIFDCRKESKIAVCSGYHLALYYNIILEYL